MKKFFFLFSILFTSFCFSQNSFRIFYKVDSKLNKENDSITTDIYLLDTYPKDKLTLFYNYVYYNTDSTMSAIKEVSDRNGGVNFDFNTLKNYNWNKGILSQNNNLFSIEIFDGDSYKFNDPINLKWELSNEQKKCGDYNCQKATTKFKGREWEAWFTKDVPLNISPYKFSGLPGIIYEINDKTNSYKFTIIGLKKINDNPPYYPSSFKKSIPTSKRKYLQAFQNFKTDPAKKLRDGFLVTESGETIEIFGGFSKAFIEKKTNAIKNLLQYNNNPIELE